MDTIKLTIVDDEALIRKAIKYELEERHARVECHRDDAGIAETKEITVLDTFANAAQLFTALNDADRPRPDYLLLDMEFQGEPTGGMAIADRVRRQYCSSTQQPIGIIIFSGRFDNPLPSTQNRQRHIVEVGYVIFEALRRGANAFVSKNAMGGFGVDNIIQAIASLERGEKYYFNYPVMLTLMEAAEAYFRQQHRQPLDEEISDDERQLLLWEAAGCTAQDIATRMTDFVDSDKNVQDRQKELSRKLNTVNKSGARIAKAIACGLLDPNDIPYLKR